MKNSRTILAIIVLLYVAQQAIGLQLRWGDDESWYLLPANSLLQEGRLRIPVFATSEREFWAGPPVLPLLQAASWRLHEMSVIQARLLTVLFGIGTIVLTYALGRRLVDERTGLVGAALCSVDTLVFTAGRTNRPEILACFFGLLALCLLLKALQENTWWPVVASGCSIGIGLWTHPNVGCAALCGVALLLWYQGWRFLRKPQIYVLTVTSTLVFLPLVIFVFSHDVGTGFKSVESLGKIYTGGKSNIIDILLASAKGEIMERYVKFIWFPYRLHIGILTVAALVIGFARRNRASRFFATCIVLYLLYFWGVAKYLKSPRYLTLIMPFVALLWADWLVILWMRWREAVSSHQAARAVRYLLAFSSLIALTGLSQLAANMGYLWQYRHADYPRVCRQIDELIPADARIYGSMTFWLGLHHHTYVPYMRMSWAQAVDEFHTNTLILDDRVMVEGSSPGEWDAMREELHNYVDRHGRLLGEIHNPWYGDLKVYEVAHPEKADRPRAGDARTVDDKG